MRDAYIALVYLSFLVLGTAAPFVFGLGYVWVDAFNPQYVAATLLGDIPVSQVMALAALGGYIVLDRRQLPRVSLFTVLTLSFAAWVTLTLAWAEAPDWALDKWNWAFKTIAFSAFIPFLFRSRIQIEALISVWVFALAVQIIPVGAKTVLSGGGYGQELGVVAGNAGLSEGASLAAVSLMVVPLLLFLRTHGEVIPRSKLCGLVYLGLIVASLTAAVGTFERTGLVGLVVLGVASWIRARRKIVFGIGIALSVVIVLAVSSDRWSARMATIDAPAQDDSALTRLLVWGWTWRFVQSHPLGGGFAVYTKSVIVYPAKDDEEEPVVVIGRAFHSIYFEVLGEQGFLGLALFLALAGNTFWSMQRLRRHTRNRTEMHWCRDLAGALQVSLLILLVCGAFIGIAFQPMFYMLFAMGSCLQQHVRRALAAAPQLRPMAGPAFASPALRRFG